MKKLFLFVVLAMFVSINMNAQGENNDSSGNDEFTTGIQKGDWTLTASLNYGSSKQAEDKSNNFGIMPRVGYQVTDNINVGIGLGYMSWKGENNNVDYQDENEFTIGASAYYFFRPGKRFSPYAGIGFDYVTMDDKLDDDFGKSNGFDIGASFGAIFWLNDCWGLKTSVAGLGYSTRKGDYTGAEARNDFNLDLNLKNVWFGVTKKF